MYALSCLMVYDLSILLSLSFLCVTTNTAFSKHRLTLFSQRVGLPWFLRNVSTTVLTSLPSSLSSARAIVERLSKEVMTSEGRTSERMRTYQFGKERCEVHQLRGVYPAVATAPRMGVVQCKGSPRALLCPNEEGAMEFRSDPPHRRTTLAPRRTATPGCTSAMPPTRIPYSICLSADPATRRPRSSRDSPSSSTPTGTPGTTPSSRVVRRGSGVGLMFVDTFSTPGFRTLNGVTTRWPASAPPTRSSGRRRRRN